MFDRDVIVIGGGAAGFFGAIACAEAGCTGRMTLLEKGPAVLAKVRISGGGRCNVTHACFDPRELARRYPRGGQALIGPFHRFQPRDTVAWFAERGVELKTEADGRMFPVTDSSQTILDCLIASARKAGITVRTGAEVSALERTPDGLFDVRLATGEHLRAGRVLIATGGARTASLGALPVSLGHTLEPPAPSLFTFEVPAPWLHELAGLSVDPAEVSVPGTTLKERGPLLITHRGLSGPAVLRLSAWGARELHARDYHFEVLVHWLPGQDLQAVDAGFEAARAQHGARQVTNTPAPGIPSRLWRALVAQAGVGAAVTWSQLSRAARGQLARQLVGTRLPVTGKSLNKDEFVTCGGVRLSEVDFKTMESRKCPGLHLAGEALDIDGITGGFNFQAAWTTGWIAGRAMAA